MITEKIDGHTLQVGELPSGPGIRTVIDGEDVTDEFLNHVGPPPDNGHGIPIPRGKGWAMAVMKNLFRSGELP